MKLKSSHVCKSDNWNKSQIQEMQVYLSYLTFITTLKRLASLLYVLLRLSDLTFIVCPAWPHCTYSAVWLDLHCMSDLTSLHPLHLSDLISLLLTDFRLFLFDLAFCLYGLTFLAPMRLPSIWFDLTAPNTPIWLASICYRLDLGVTRVGIYLSW
jgi:hypothetical protein